MMRWLRALFFLGPRRDLCEEIRALLRAGPLPTLAIADALRISAGSAYSMLRGMEADGELASYLGDELIPERGNRPRRYWKLDGTRRFNDDSEISLALREAGVGRVMGLA